MMWSLLRYNPCVMLHRLRKTTYIFDMTNGKADKAHMYLTKTSTSYH
jgi:hypothetical protein